MPRLVDIFSDNLRHVKRLWITKSVLTSGLVANPLLVDVVRARTDWSHQPFTAIKRGNEAS